MKKKKAELLQGRVSCLSENNQPAKFYKLTTADRKQLESECETWERFSGAVAAILRDA